MRKRYTVILATLLVSFHCIFAQDGVFSLKSKKLKNGVSEEFAFNPAFKGCEKELEPPSEKNSPIKTYVIDLNSPPQQRWNEVVNDKKQEILDLLASVRENSDEWFGKKAFHLVDEYLPSLARTLPHPFYEEIQGMAQAINVTIGEVTLFNVFYEFFSVCTSIVSQTTDGQIYHARNLDFGFFLGWDIKNKTWQTTEKLRPLVVKLDFVKGNEILFQSISFAGYLGVLTGVKPNAFSLTVNERFKLTNGGFIGVIEWVFGLHNQQWVGFLTRTIMENSKSYTDAQKILSKEPLVSPVYFILAGTKPYQGCIITRGRNSFEILSLSPGTPWYLIQTNYDHWTTPPFYDNRVRPSKTCLVQLGRKNVVHTLYNVLSTRPVFNKLTVYSTIMQASTGIMNTWLQKCEDPCWPW